MDVVATTWNAAAEERQFMRVSFCRLNALALKWPVLLLFVTPLARTSHMDSPEEAK